LGSFFEDAPTVGFFLVFPMVKVKKITIQKRGLDKYALYYFSKLCENIGNITSSSQQTHAGNIDSGS